MTFKMRSKLWKSGPMKPTSKLSVDIPDAASRATRFITELTNGIFVHAEGKGPNDTQAPTGWSMLDALEYIMEGVTRFWVGVKQGASNVTMRFGVDTESHMELDYHSLQLVDQNGAVYFHVSDSRGSDGTAELTESYETDESSDVLGVNFNIVEVVEVLVDGAAATVDSFSYVNIWMSETVPAGSSVEITYKTDSSSLKSYTAGYRELGSHNGAMSFAEGTGTVSSGYASHAEGAATVSSEYTSHAEGMGTHATASAAHSEGTVTVASGSAAHAEGQMTRAQGKNSHAQNMSTTAGYDNQTAIGKYNDNKSNNAFEIGNGTRDSARSNAFAVDWSGNVEAAGKVVGTHAVLATSSGSYMLADQTITLSENVSDQANGIVLAWSAYANGAAQNSDWHYQFIPKEHVARHNGMGVSTFIMSSDGAYCARKYVYVHDDRIVGNAQNTDTGTEPCGITFTNTRWVLRYVFGI